VPGSSTQEAGRVLEGRVRLGKVVGVHGLKGWLKLLSHTEPREGIFDYQPLIIGGQVIEKFNGKVQGKGLLLHIEGRDDRTAVEDLVGKLVEIERGQMAELSGDEYYWSDLEGLQVFASDGHDFGRVTQVMNTGANDVLVVQGSKETLIPFVQGVYVLEVDLDAGKMLVDWSPDYL
jgi:16S rRNA processing protein RimM